MVWPGSEPILKWNQWSVEWILAVLNCIRIEPRTGEKLSGYTCSSGHFHSRTCIRTFHPMGGRVCYCTAHYVIVDQWNRSLPNLLKKSSRTEVVRTLSRTLSDIVGRWQLSGSLYVFLIVTSYTLIYTHAQLTGCEASRKAYGLSSFARY